MTARPLLISALATLLLLTMACGGGGSAGTGSGSNTWVGKVEGTDAYAVLLIKETGRYVFITDGKDVTYLFRGNIGETDINNYFTLRDNTNHVLNVQAPQGNVFKGLITIGQGQHLNFSVEPAKGEAGLYRAKEGTTESSWIVLEDGTFRGAKIGADGKVEALAVRGGVKWTDPSTDP